MSCIPSTLLLLATLTAGAAAGPTIRLARPEGKPAFLEVAGLSRIELDRLGKADLSPEKGPEVFAIYVLNDKGELAKDQPPVLGSYKVEDAALRFTPRFPLRPGLIYRAVFRPARLPGAAGGEDVRTDIEVARPQPAAATEVTQVYPSSDKLPENQLKFYLHFSAPMSRREAYRNIRLLDDKGKAVDMPFLELDEELWDRSGKRFTLFIDPGRIKRGVKPREDVGPALVEGRTYTLVIDRKWHDADGNALKDTFRKTFRVGPPVEDMIEPKDWKLDAPAAGAAAALKVKFPRPLDHALLQDLLWVTDAKGERGAGSVHVTDQETCWQFTPTRPWAAGKYDLVVDKTLEDLAGNSVGKPFEVDLFRKIDPEVKPETVRRAFEVKK